MSPSPAGNGPGQTPTRRAQDTGSCPSQHHPSREQQALESSELLNTIRASFLLTAALNTSHRVPILQTLTAVQRAFPSTANPSTPPSWPPPPRPARSRGLSQLQAIRCALDKTSRTIRLCAILLVTSTATAVPILIMALVH